ncbi:MAG TPA: glycosyl hydrolase family 65 protein, partial [Trueperaceae bacterium]|nr:glycosyl hydrolase family 65 protein [Trueperaceae bacterium]
MATIPGTYLNGFHERAEIVYPEDAYGLARVSQTLLNVTSGTTMRLWLNGERVTLAGDVSDYRRSLDMRSGVLTRSYLWRSSGGARARLGFVRAVSLSEAPRAGLRLTVEPLDGPMSLRITHVLDGRVENQVERGDPRVGTALAGLVLLSVAHAHDGERLLLRQRAPHSGLELVCAAAHAVSGMEAASTFHSEPLLATADFEAHLEQAAALDVQLVYLDSRRVDPAELTAAARRELAAYANSGGVTGLFERQRKWFEAFWRDADVEIAGDTAVQQSLRFSLFHLLQGAGRDGLTNIASKGLTGEGYEGHTFWDSEIYVVPVFTYLRPELARALLAYRVGQLPAARARAHELRRTGALYPWRTIAGPEASAYYPAGTAQIHIDGDITLALERYLQATADLDLMWDGGADVVIECARFYSRYGHVSDDGSFHLHTVTGPDEYTALIDDNHYTNKLARQTLRFAVGLANVLRSSDPVRFEALASRLELTQDELDRFAGYARLMYLPVAGELGITPQDASFLGKPEWPWDSVPDERYPLLLSYHPLDIYRHQVLKQADVLLAHVLLPEDVPRWRLRRDANYYAARTTHDSSLSACAHAIVAAELNLMDAAVSFFDATARTDLDDLQGNGEHGVHVAAMGGAWLTTVFGFAGLRVKDDKPTFRPRLPRRWRRLRFRLRWRGCLLEVDADHDTTRYR